jgi:hypothetical protein
MQLLGTMLGILVTVPGWSCQYRGAALKGRLMWLAVACGGASPQVRSGMRPLATEHDRRRPRDGRGMEDLKKPKAGAGVGAL